MTYEESEKKLFDNVKIIDTNGNERFPYHIDRLLIMPVKRDHESELCIIKWVVGHDIPIKRAIEVCMLTKEDFDIYVYTKTEGIAPMLLSEYFS